MPFKKVVSCQSASYKPQYVQQKSSIQSLLKHIPAKLGGPVTSVACQHLSNQILTPLIPSLDIRHLLQIHYLLNHLNVVESNAFLLVVSL